MVMVNYYRVERSTGSRTLLGLDILSSFVIMSKRADHSTSASDTLTDYKLFLRALQKILVEQFEDTEYRLATAAKLDPALLKRVRSGERAPTPLFIGKIAKAVGDDHGNMLIAAYLNDVERQVRQMRPSRRG